MMGIIVELGLKLCGCFRKVILSPEEVAQPEVDVRLFRIGSNGRAKLFGRSRVITRLVERFTGQHVRLCRFGIQGENLLVDIENALILFAPQATVGERQPEGQALRISFRRLPQIWNRYKIVPHTVVRHAEQDCKALVVRMLLELGGEGFDGVLEVFGLEEREAEIHLEPRQPRIECERFAVVGDGVVVAFLAGFDQAQMGERLCVLRIAASYALPRLLGFSVLPLLLKRQGILTGAVLSGEDGGSGDCNPQHSQQQPCLTLALHLVPGGTSAHKLVGLSDFGLDEYFCRNRRKDYNYSSYTFDAEATS